MMKRIVKRVMSGMLAAVMLMTSVPVLAEETPEAAVIGEEEEITLEVEYDKLTSIETCKPTYISTGLSDEQFYKLTPGYGIEAHKIPLYVGCEHETGYVYITESMCSYYQSDWLNEILKITVTYNGASVVLPVMYTYGLPFVDVKKSDWFFDSVVLMYDSKLMTGMTETVFGPYESLSRAQFAVILWRLEGSNVPTTTKRFPDVPSGSWFEHAVLWAYETGIIKGYENGYFGPGDLITREQMALMIYRYLTAFVPAKGHANINQYIDYAYVSPYATEAFSWAVGNGIITGKDNGTRLAPFETATRAECAVIIDRYTDYVNRTYY